MFEIDERLEALVGNGGYGSRGSTNGEISEEIKLALATYADAFGYKVIYQAQPPGRSRRSESAQREADRFQARYKAAENREKRSSARRSYGS